MAFGTATVVTTLGKALVADRIRTTPATYTTSPKWIAMGVGATGAARTAVVGDTALTTETETRAVGVESNPSGPVYQTQGTITATTARAVDEAGCFTQLAVGGTMFVSATFGVITLGNADSIQFTFQITMS